MAWTYAADMALARDRIRFVVADTDIGDQLVQDEEIALYTTGAFAQSSDLGAAIQVQRAILAKLSRRVDVSAGQTSVKLSQQYTAAKERLTDLMRTSAEGAVPYLGGVTRSDRATRESDTDRLPPYFDRTTNDPQETTTQPSTVGW